MINQLSKFSDVKIKQRVILPFKYAINPQSDVHDTEDFMIYTLNVPEYLNVIVDLLCAKSQSSEVKNQPQNKAVIR